MQGQGLESFELLNGVKLPQQQQEEYTSRLASQNLSPHSSSHIHSYNRLAQGMPCTWCRLRLLAAQGLARSIAPHRSFGLLGVDLMVDASGRPWLLEVNNCPNISGATGHVARDARAAAWRGDVFDNRASKNYEVSAADVFSRNFVIFCNVGDRSRPRY